MPDSVVAMLPLLADMDAVGVPEATFKNANLALVVLVPPMAKS